MLEWTVLRSELMRLYAVMGAPMRSGPYSGKPWTYLPVLNAASASRSEAVFAPWPPRPCQRISTMSFMRCLLLSFLCLEAGKEVRLRPGPSLLYRKRGGQ